MSMDDGGTWFYLHQNLDTVLLTVYNIILILNVLILHGDRYF